MTNPTPTPPTNPPQSPATPTEPSWREVFQFPLACALAIVGAALGAGAAKLGAQSGFYALPLVGLGTGLAVAAANKRGSVVLGAIALLVAIPAGVLTEWAYWPFVADNSLGYFIQHFFDIAGFRLLLHAFSAAMAFWIGWRRG